MPADFPSSIREINNLPESTKHEIYRTLLPDWIFSEYDINPLTFMANNHLAIRFRCPDGSRAFEMTIKRFARDIDPLVYLNVTDTFNNQILVLLVVVNDPESPRFNIDVDEEGNTTNLGTIGRNIPAEIAAMEAGLAPGQVRQGLRRFGTLEPLFTQFITRMGHDMFLIEPFAYHNAIVFERYGFNYVRGLSEMHRIHESFQHGGELHGKLNNSNPFRSKLAWQTIRARSWSIHDGILGHPFTGFQMYKRIGYHPGICTFPNNKW